MTFLCSRNKKLPTQRISLRHLFWFSVGNEKLTHGSRHVASRFIAMTSYTVRVLNGIFKLFYTTIIILTHTNTDWTVLKRFPSLQTRLKNQNSICPVLVLQACGACICRWFMKLWKKKKVKDIWNVLFVV